MAEARCSTSVVTAAAVGWEGAAARHIGGDGRGGSAAEGCGGGSLVAMAGAEARLVVRPSRGAQGRHGRVQHSTLVVTDAVAAHRW